MRRIQWREVGSIAFNQEVRYPSPWIGSSVRYEQTITGSTLTIGMLGTKPSSTCRPVSKTSLCGESFAGRETKKRVVSHRRVSRGNYAHHLERCWGSFLRPSSYISLSLSLFLFLRLRRLVLHFFSSFYACSDESKVKKEREEDRWNRAEMKSNRRKIESLSIETWHSITSGENFLLITMGTYLCLLCSITPRKRLAAI